MPAADKNLPGQKYFSWQDFWPGSAYWWAREEKLPVRGPVSLCLCKAALRLMVPWPGVFLPGPRSNIATLCGPLKSTPLLLKNVHWERMATLAPSVSHLDLIYDS